MKNTNYSVNIIFSKGERIENMKFSNRTISVRLNQSNGCKVNSFYRPVSKLFSFDYEK